MNTRRLYRSRNDKQLAGVAAGMAEYLELDPTLVRILWILSVFLGGFTILLYIILAFIVPLAPAAAPGQGPSWAAGGVAGGWGPGGAWAPSAAPGPGGTPAATPPSGAGDGTEDGDAAGTLADTSQTQGWAPAQAGWVDPAWTGDQGWTAPTQEPATEHRRGPGGAVYAGVLLVVFGVIALADAVVPGLAGISLAPALLMALGAVLLIGSIRRPASQA